MIRILAFAIAIAFCAGTGRAETIDIGHRVFIRAMRNIKPGEEIVYDYGIDYLKNVIGRSNCQCSRCRKRRNRRAAELRHKRARKAA